MGPAWYVICLVGETGIPRPEVQGTVAESVQLTSDSGNGHLGPICEAGAGQA